MGIFDPEWKKLHIKMCRDYEDIAIDSFTGGPIDFLETTAKALVKCVPQFSEKEAQKFIDLEYKSFKEFDVYSVFLCECKIRNPQVSDNNIKEIFEFMKARFLKQETEHEYFMYFVISKIIEMKDLGITRGSYLIEISRGNKPKTTGIFRRANQIANSKWQKIS